MSKHIGMILAATVLAGLFARRAMIEHDKVTGVKARLNAWYGKSPQTFTDYWDRRHAEEQS